jgi:hypothetical protein
MSRRLFLAHTCAVLFLTLSAFGQSKSPQPGGPPEYDVKAAFLLNFTRFVEWPQPSPQRAAEPFSICILGDDPFGDSLNRIIAGEKIAGRPILIKHIRKFPDACELLFIPASEPSQAAVLSQARRDVLTVGEAPDFLRDGGMIRFLIDDHRVRFDINRQAVDRSFLKMSARLLGVARVIK